MAEQREIRSPEQLNKARLDEIFDLLGQVKNHDEVEGALKGKGLDKVAPPPPIEEVKWKIGEDAVRAVLEVLPKHPRLFKRYRVSERWSDEDREGRDVVVTLTRAGRLADSSGEIYIQVKSSEKGVADFRQKTAQSDSRVPRDRVTAIGLEGAIDEYFFEHRIIVVSAGANDDADENLMKGYRGLCSYWAMKMAEVRRD